AESMTTAYHFTARYTKEDAALTADYQHAYAPYWASEASYKCFFYTGFGLAGEVIADEAASENYFLRLPLGAQANWTALRLQFFGEAAVRVGPLPETSL